MIGLATGRVTSMSLTMERVPKLTTNLKTYKHGQSLSVKSLTNIIQKWLQIS